MKIVLTGSLGHINKDLIPALLFKGHELTVISSKDQRADEIHKAGARAAIGSIEDSKFLAETFRGADIVYLMEPPFDFFDHTGDMETYYTNLAEGFASAIKASGVTKVIHLSSIGGHTDEGVGMLAAHHRIETILNRLPGEVVIKTMRPVGFYYNIFAFIPAIKNAGAIFQNYGGDDKEPWVSPTDIAEAIAEEIDRPFDKRVVRYVASDEISPNELAKLLGESIGKPELKWTVIPDDAFRENLTKIGFSMQAAIGLTDMNAGRKVGLYADYYKNKPALGRVKLTDYVSSFAAAYNAPDPVKGH